MMEVGFSKNVNVVVVIFAFAIELADMDNDGDLDAIVGGHEYGGMFTGIYWNDGQGNFMPYDTTPLKQTQEYGEQYLKYRLQI